MVFKNLHVQNLSSSNLPFSLNLKTFNFSENKTELKPNINKRPRTIKKVSETRFREAISDVQNKRKVVPKEEEIFNFNNSSEKRQKPMNVSSSANLRARRSVVKMLMVNKLKFKWGYMHYPAFTKIC